MRIKRITDFHQIIRFLLSGGAATLLHFSVMGALIYAGIDAAIATTLGAIMGALLNYILQYYFTFNSQRQHIHSAMSYIGASSLAWVSNLLVFVFFHDFLLLNIIFSQLAATGLVTIQNYFVYNRLVFHSR